MSKASNDSRPWRGDLGKKRKNGRKLKSNYKDMLDVRLKGRYMMG
jgi:hypothetical protein